MTNQETIATFNRELQAELKIQGGDRRKAVLAIARRNPGLHKEWLAANQTTRFAASQVRDSEFIGRRAG